MSDLSSFDCLDDLQLSGWKLWQNSRFFRFGTDGVLLAEFARCTPKEQMIDLCSGTGVIPFLLLAQGRARQACALELQSYLCRLMEKSAAENNCRQQLQIIEGDVKEIRSLAPGRAFDLVTVNPPYEPMGRGILGQNPHRELARREVACTLNDVVAAAAYLLKSGGRLAMIHRPFRLPEIFKTLDSHGFCVSRMRLVEPCRGERPALVLMEAILHSKRELVVEPTLVIHEGGNNA